MNANYPRFARNGDWIASGDYVSRDYISSLNKHTNAYQPTVSTVPYISTLSSQSSVPNVQTLQTNHTNEMTSTNTKLKTLHSTNSASPEFIELFSDIGPTDFTKHLYSFTMMLYFNTPTRSDFYTSRKVVLRSLDMGQKIDEMEVKFPVKEDRGHTMKMIITDLTAYQSNQKLLVLNVIVNSGAITIPLSFVEATTENLLNRQIEIPLAQVEMLEMTFNLQRM